MKKPKPPRGKPQNQPLTATEEMQLISSGNVVAPTPHLTFSLAGFRRLRLFLRGVVMDSPPDGLIARFSEDGSNFAAGADDYRFQRTTMFDEVAAEVGLDNSMSVIAVSNSEPHFAEIDIEPGEANEINNIWIMPFIRSVSAPHTSSGPVNEQTIARFENYNTQQTHLRVQGADGHSIVRGQWWLYGLSA